MQELRWYDADVYVHMRVAVMQINRLSGSGKKRRVPLRKLGFSPGRDRLE